MPVLQMMPQSIHAASLRKKTEVRLPLSHSRRCRSSILISSWRPGQKRGKGLSDEGTQWHHYLLVPDSQWSGHFYFYTSSYFSTFPRLICHSRWEWRTETDRPTLYPVPHTIIFLRTWVVHYSRWLLFSWHTWQRNVYNWNWATRISSVISQNLPCLYFFFL